MRDRSAEDDAADGAVDKSVVNWLMQVISGKDPIELGINAVFEEEAAEEPGPQIVASRDEAKEKAAASSQVTVTAEDLCGAPLYPVSGARKAVYPVVDDGDASGASVKAPAPTQAAAEAEPSAVGKFKRMFGLKLVEGATSAPVPASDDGRSSASGLLRDGDYYGPPPTEASASIASTVRGSKPQPPDLPSGGIDPVDLTRDPDYYEEKMREREFSVDEVDWVPPETVPVMAEFAPGFEADAELVQVVHASPAAVTIADPFAGVEENSEPEMRVAEVAAAAPEFALAAPEFVDPFAGIDFSTGPVAAVAESIGTVAEPEAMVAPAAPEFVDPFAGIDFAGPVAAVAEPIGTEAEAVVAMPEPESEEAVPEAEAVVAVPEPEVVEAAPGAEAVVAMPEPEVEAYEESEAEVVSEATVDEPEIAALEIAEPEVVGEEEVLYVPEVAAQAEESMEAEAESPSAESDSGPEAAETAAASEAETEAAEIRTPWTVAAARRNPNDITFSAQEYYQQQVGKKYSTKAVAEAGQTSPFGKEAEANPEDFSAALKTLMQLGSVLPLAARMSTASEGEEGVDMAGGGNQEVKQEVSGLRLLQYEIKTTVQDHSTHLKRLEDQLTQILESAEMGSADSASVMDNVKSTAKMVRVMGIGLGLMLMVLILMIGMILVHAK